MALNLTRRSLLAAMPVAGSAMALPAVAYASAPDAGLELAIAAYERLKAQANHFDTTVYEPALEVCAQRLAAIPHATTKRQYVQAGTGRLASLSTADRHSVAMARRVAADFKNLHGDYEDACRELVALADDIRRQADEIEADAGVSHLARQSDEHGNRSCQALYAVEDYPVTTLPAMMRKIEVLSEALGGDDVLGDWTLADLRRIAGEARHGNA